MVPSDKRNRQAFRHRRQRRTERIQECRIDDDARNRQHHRARLCDVGRRERAHDEFPGQQNDKPVSKRGRNVVRSRRSAATFSARCERNGDVNCGFGHG